MTISQWEESCNQGLLGIQKDKTDSPERRWVEIREGFLEEEILEQAEELSWKCSGTSGVGLGDDLSFSSCGYTGLWNGDDLNEGRKRSQRSGFAVQKSGHSHQMNLKSRFGWTEGSRELEELWINLGHDFFRSVKERE